MKPATVYSLVLYRKWRAFYDFTIVNEVGSGESESIVEISLSISVKGMHSGIRIKYLRVGFVFNLTNLLCLRIILSIFCGFLDKVKNSHMKNNSVFLHVQETLLTFSSVFSSYFHVKVIVTYIDNLQRNM